MNEIYCLVDGCRFPQKHITRAHMCTCGMFGHGQRECNNRTKMNELLYKVRQYQIPFPQHLYCTVIGCRSPHTHCNSSHVCEYCGRREHGPDTCIYSQALHQSQGINHEQNNNANANANANQNQNKPESIKYKFLCPFCRSSCSIPEEQKKIPNNELICGICMEKADMFCHVVVVLTFV
jgi:hypothetical protein